MRNLFQSYINFLRMRVFEYLTKALDNQLIDQIIKSSNNQIILFQSPHRSAIGSAPDFLNLALRFEVGEHSQSRRSIHARIC